MAVTIVGTLEMIFTSGGETVSEAVHVDFASPTDVPLPLHESIVFTDRTPPVDIRDALEAHLADEDAHGFTDVTRVPVSRDGAMAEWTAVRDGITRAIVLWFAVPLRQEGIDWGVTAVGDERLLYAYQSIPIGDGAEATGEASIAIGYNAKSTEESSTAMGHDASAAGKQSLAVGRGSNAGGINSIAIGVDSEATGLDSTAVGQNADATNTRATAVGRDSHASGENATAYGWGSVASGQNSIAIGVSSDATGEDSTAIGQDASASGTSSVAAGQGVVASGSRATAVGVYSTALSTESVAVGFGADVELSPVGIAIGASSKVGGSEGAVALGPQAHIRENSTDALALGFNAMVLANSPRSHAIGAFTTVPENTPDTTVLSAKHLDIKPGPGALGNTSTITLYDASGNPHVIPATVGQTHSYSANTSPGGESLTGVGTYATAGVLRTGTLQSFIPEITTGLWDVDIEAHALVYRSVATGGVYLFVGNGTASYQQALGRLSPQTNAYTLNVNVSPSTVGGTALKAVGPGQVIDMRYTGFQTAGTTHVVNHGWKITARRVG